MGQRYPEYSIPEDGLSIAEATDETWVDLSQWMRWAIDHEVLTNPSNCQKYALLSYEKFLEKKDFTFGGFSKINNDFILIARLAPLDIEENLYEFCGCWCRKKFQKQGLMTEALDAIIKYGINELSAKKFQISHADGNNQAQQLVKKLGFSLVRIIKKKHCLPQGQIVDEHVSLLSKN